MDYLICQMLEFYNNWEGTLFNRRVHIYNKIVFIQLN